MFELDNYEEPIDLINIDHHDDVFNGDYIGEMGVNEGLSKEYFEMESVVESMKEIGLFI